jgi:hypothetical protein
MAGRRFMLMGCPVCRIQQSGDRVARSLSPARHNAARESFGDAAITPVRSGQRPARRSELSRCPAARPRGRHSRRVAHGEEEGSVAARRGTCIARAGASVSACIGEPKAVHLRDAC